MNEATKPISSKHQDTAKKHSSFRAVFLALLVDLGGSNVAMSQLYSLYTFFTFMDGASNEQAEVAYTEFGLFSLMGFIGLLIGVIFSILGGYVCATNSVVRVYRDTFIYFAILATFSLFIVSQFTAFTETLITTLVTGLAIFFGAYLGNKKLKPHQSSS